MRELKKDELKAVSGGTLFLIGGLLRLLFGGHRSGGDHGGGHGGKH